MPHELIALSDTARVWIYPADRVIKDDEVAAISQQIDAFLEEWSTHGTPMKTYGNVFHSRFICIFNEESLTAASGCSIDSSVRFVRSLGEQYGIDFFNRTIQYYMDDAEQIHAIALDQLSDAYAAGHIQDATLFFDNLVATKGDFKSSWLRPLKDSKLYRFVK